MNAKNEHSLPVEVQLAWEAMTCKAMRETYDEEKQPCRFCSNHSFALDRDCPYGKVDVPIETNLKARLQHAADKMING